MKQSPPWAEALKIKAVDLESWHQEAPRNGDSFTFWCVDKGKLRAKDYFHWAMENYQLAYVNDEYFHQPPNHELWSLIQKVTNWSPALLPIEQWDGVIFVACVEPPEDVHWSFPVQYVLAHPKNLRKLWSDLAQAPSEPSILAEAVASVPPEVPPASASDLETPAGLELDLNLPPLPDSDQASFEAPVAAPSFEAPDGFDLVALNLIPDETPSAPQEEIVALPPTPDEDNGPQGFSINLPGPKPASAPKPPSSGPIGAIDVDELAPPRLESAQEEDQMIAWAFQQMRGYYQMCMVLLFEGGDQLRPYRWDSSLKPISKESLHPIDASKPSPFRIVHRTRQAYHGHLVENELVKEFFMRWGFQKSLPAHITLVPLQMNDQMTGILLAIGDQSANNPAALVLAVKIVNRLSEALYQSQNQAA